MTCEFGVLVFNALLRSSVMWRHAILYKGTNTWQKPSVCRWHEVLPKTWHFHCHMESACFFEEYDIRVPEYVVEYWQNLAIPTAPYS
jgi:hypothetical protein